MLTFIPTLQNVMYVNKIKYYQFKDDPRFWDLGETEFDKINLVVGKNSSGKSKTIAILNSLSILLSENVKLPFSDGYYDVLFQTFNKIPYRFEFSYSNGQIIKEKLTIGDKVYVDRDADGGGFILNSDGQIHRFKIPSDELKVNRRDEIQYPYLEELNFWAKHVRVFYFNTFLGKNSLGFRDKNKKIDQEFNLKATDLVVDTFNRGVKKHKEAFTNSIINDFNQIGFNIEAIELGSLLSVGLQVVENPDLEVLGIRIKEKDLNCMTDQNEMSMGMFRALAIIIHFNYYKFENISGCVLIDDIGEGLDYERSVKLIELLVSKVESNANNNVQLIVSTNDRFIMNSVDLKYWQIVDREGCHVKYYNLKNSPNIFSDFKFTGLNNFDFFATNFFKDGLKNQ